VLFQAEGVDGQGGDAVADVAVQGTLPGGVVGVPFLVAVGVGGIPVPCGEVVEHDVPLVPSNPC